MSGSSIEPGRVPRLTRLPGSNRGALLFITTLTGALSSPDGQERPHFGRGGLDPGPFYAFVVLNTVTDAVTPTVSHAVQKRFEGLNKKLLNSALSDRGFFALAASINTTRAVLLVQRRTRLQGLIFDGFWTVFAIITDWQVDELDPPAGVLMVAANLVSLYFR